MMTFSANYSASRASLLLFWNAIEKWRADLSSWMLNPIYQQWLQEEIDAGNISAPGYGSTTGRRAWSRCNWIGINHPSIDPLKEANAATVRIREGLTTRDREAAAYNGSDFADNVSELAIENRQLMQATYDMDEFDMEALDDERDAE
jgi:capsid protein